MIFTLVLGVFCSCSKKSDDTSYAISGYVYDESGSAVEGVVISGNGYTSTTDENGKYTISNIVKSIVISPEKQGYKFAQANKFISSASTEVNFIASKEYNLNGKAHNNGAPLANASVTASSLAGTFYTTTDENGNFEFPGVAGECSIRCEVDGLELYETTASIDNFEDIEITTSTSLKINFNFDETNPDYSQIKVLVGGVENVLSSSTLEINDISCGTIVEVVSESYYFERATSFVMNSLNQTETFDAQKIYQVTGTVQSGSTRLAQAKLYIDGKFVKTIGENGVFTMPGMYGTKQVTVKRLGYGEQTLEANFSNKTLDFDLSKTVLVKVISDYENDGYDIKFSKTAVKNKNEYSISDVKIGDSISLSSNKYSFENYQIVINENNTYFANCYAKYDANVTISGGLQNVEYLLDGEPIGSDGYNGLYGSHVVSARLDGYVFNLESINFNSKNVVLGYQIPYSVSLSVVTGDISIENAKVVINSQTFYTDADGKLTLSSLIGSQTVTVSKAGYNSQTFSVENSSEKTVDLSFDVDGCVKTDDVYVSNASVVLSGDEANVLAETNADGYFKIENLHGQVVLKAKKQGYTFGETESISSKTDNLVITGSYQICVSVQIDGEPVNYCKVILRNVSGDEQSFYTDENGECVIATFESNSLSGKYYLRVEHNNSDNINIFESIVYAVSGYGTYRFSTTGFAISGTVKCGNLPISGAKVTAGTDSVYTDNEGKYKFDFITEQVEVSVQKAGYAFSSPVQVSENSENVNFEATYAVSGKVTFNSKPLSGVKVSLKSNSEIYVTTGENGSFEISNLSGENELVFEKTGYKFASNYEVSQPVSNILVSPKILLSVSVKCGDEQLSDYVCKLNGVAQNVVAGVATLEANVNDELTFTKTGYSIQSITVGESFEYVASASYAVSGIVKTGDIELGWVKVYLDEETQNPVATTNSSGAFEVSGLTGTHVLKFEKEGYIFTSENIAGYSENLSISASFEVKGTVYLCGNKLDGILVTLNGKDQTETQNGAFSFITSGRFSLEFTDKNNIYEFSDVISNEFEQREFSISAKFSLSGVVRSGTITQSGNNVDNVIAGATVSLTQRNGEKVSMKTLADGKFSFSGLVSVSSITVEKQGYVSQSQSGFSKTNNSIIFDLAYSVSVTFDTAGVTVLLDDSAIVVTGKTWSKSGLVGLHSLKFELANTSFSRNNIEVSGPNDYNISTTKSYNISGYVKTDKGIAVSGVTIKTDAGNSAVTNGNGYYELDNVAGRVYVESDALKEDSSYKYQENITKDGEINFTITNLEFSYLLYSEAFKKLDSAQSVQMVGDGSVTGKGGLGPIQISTTQNVHALFKRDNNGNIIKNNLNYGDVVSGIDPKVSLIVYYNKKEKKTYSDLLRESDVTSTTTANHTGVTENSEVKKTYGAEATEYSPYIVTKDTISSTNVVVSESGYSFTLTLSNSQPGYQAQITALAPSGTTFKSFDSIYFDVVIDKNGFLKTICTREKYYINQMVDVTVNSTITYTYYTDKLNYKIDDIDVSSQTAIANSLKLSTQTEIAQAQSYTVSDSKKDSGNVVSKLIYGY